MNPIYGSIYGYRPNPSGGLLIDISYTVTPGTPYRWEFSTDFGATWQNAGTITFAPVGTVTTFNYPLAVPGGYPTRFVPQS